MITFSFNDNIHNSTWTTNETKKEINWDHAQIHWKWPQGGGNSTISWEAKKYILYYIILNLTTTAITFMNNKVENNG